MKLDLKLDFRDAVFQAVYDLAAQDRNVMVLTNDMGAMGLDKLRADFPRQVVNVGIAEQNMISVAAGLALAGKVVFTYGISAHVTGRCYEQLKLDVCAMNLPVIGFGIGSGLSYGVDGPTHHGTQDIALMRSLPNMTVYNPADAITANAVVHLAYGDRRPAYIRLDKDQHDSLYSAETQDFSVGLATVVPGQDLTLITTGIYVHQAVALAQVLAQEGISVGVVDLYRIKPSNNTLLRKIIQEANCLVTVEEHGAIGGIGSLVAELIAESGVRVPFQKFALPDEFYLGSASRAWGQDRYGLSSAKLATALKELLAGSKR